MDTARFADQSDPDLNPNFRRRWNSQRDPAALDRQADAELMFGHVATAEHLARRAAEMREAGWPR